MIKDLYKHDNVMHKVPNNDTFLMFGYGSLMCPRGFDGRGLSRVYTEKDFMPFKLEGYKRDLSVTYNGVYYYGIVPCDGYSVHGVLFEISYTDFKLLLANEWAYPEVQTDPMYAAVTIGGVYSKQIVTLINDPLPKEIPLEEKLEDSRTRDYVQGCLNNITNKQVKQGLLKTGGINLSDVWYNE